MALDQYYLLGKSGLRVSRLALGTMNFGTGGYHAAYGKTLDESRPIFRAYLDGAGAVAPESVYRMFTPGYQNQFISPGVKVGDKPVGYLPGVRNWL